jgi:hypothetical protein
MVLGWTARQVVVIDDDLGRSGGYDGTGGLQSAPEALWWRQSSVAAGERGGLKWM